MHAKFMAVPHYSCLKLKMPGPWGVFTAASSTTEAYLCEQEGMAFAIADVTAIDFVQIRHQP